ncbi:MAG: 1,4-dihydroxy-2-naphthoateoctaprenyltransferase, partial [Acidimicrobiaceae bacterium]|nr:1,4-dihydroxy-2-naphthoateoctaprenyltransferase [Acidimicrobiaceae bacterium]
PRPAGTLRVFVGGARPRTLAAAVVPVAVGVAVAHAEGHLSWWRAVLALVVSLSMQVGTNYANDYSDGIRGTDANRVGPARLVGGGLASPRAVKAAAMCSFAVGAVAGLVLAIATSPWLLAVGAACIAAGWLYTGGPRPYGYLGLGELFVFVFFGLVAVTGTVYVSAGHLSALAWVAAVPVGLLAVALLVVNNLRDIPGDRAAGKRTLAVVLGPHRTRLLYACCVLFAIACAGAVARWRLPALLALAALPVAVRPVRRVLSGATGRDLIPALVMTGGLQLVFGALLTAGIAW